MRITLSRTTISTRAHLFSPRDQLAITYCACAVNDHTSSTRAHLFSPLATRTAHAQLVAMAYAEWKCAMEILCRCAMEICRMEIGNGRPKGVYGNLQWMPLPSHPASFELPRPLCARMLNGAPFRHLCHCFADLSATRSSPGPCYRSSFPRLIAFLRLMCCVITFLSIRWQVSRYYYIALPLAQLVYVARSRLVLSL